MNIFMIIFIVIGVGSGLLSTVYLLGSLFAVLGYKLVRKVKYGISVFN